MLTPTPSSRDVHVEWGVKGHRIINHQASQRLPESVPDFFRASSDRIAALASMPDRWKIPELTALEDSNRPDHSLGLERLGDAEFPSTRSQYIEMALKNGLGVSGHVAASIGFLPYRIAEMFEQLTADFALYRDEVKRHGAETDLAAAIADETVRTAAIMGHFVGDSSQPLHSTVHHDGWDESFEPNPDGFTTEPGIHYRFELEYVNANVDESQVARRLQGPHKLSGSGLELALSFIRDSHKYVREVYSLDAAGKLNPDDPSVEGTELIVDRLTAGAQFLLDLWYTAWARSESVAKHLPSTQIGMSPADREMGTGDLL